MAQQARKQVKVALTKGLITEATPLTFPEDATTNELNVDFERDGHRSKRRGFGLEAQGSFIEANLSKESIINSYVWNFVGGLKETSFLVVQTEETLRFINLGASESISGGILPDQVDLRPYARGPLGRCSFASIKGHLVVASDNLNTIAVGWSDGFYVDQIKFSIRDFEYLTYEKTSLLVRGTATPGIMRKYDSFNSGWTDEFFSKFINWWKGAPELTKPYYAHKGSDGFPYVSDWGKLEGGSTLITNGHFVLDLYTMDRDSASSLVGVNQWVQNNWPALGPETSRFTTVANYAGRIFYAGMSSSRSMSRVYFSQVVQNTGDLGLLYSANDPTAEYLSDLLDTDGGYVDLPDAEGITKLHVYGTSLLVFATNGVWAISGVDDVFRATNYTVNKVTSLGLRNNATFVSAQGRPYWWSDVGIHTIALSEFKNLEEQSITETTIKRFFLGIPEVARDKALGTYDERERRVYWHYGTLEDPRCHNNLLILDEYAGAFAPWSVTVGPEDPCIVGSFYSTISKDRPGTDTVVDSSGDVVVDEIGEPVVVDVSSSTLVDRVSGTYFIVMRGTSFGFAQFNDNSMYDWLDNGYDAFLETGYRYLGDLTTYTNAPYVAVLCQRTETVWGVDGPLQQSSLSVSAFWDYKSTPATRPQEVYKIKRFHMPLDLGDPFLSEHSNVQTKIVPRGRGKALKLRFEGQHGKDFRLLGFETTDAKNSTV